MSCVFLLPSGCVAVDYGVNVYAYVDTRKLFVYIFNSALSMDIGDNIWCCAETVRVIVVCHYLGVYLDVKQQRL